MIQDSFDLQDSCINFVDCWAKTNEITDVGLLDPYAVIINQLIDMGCKVSTFIPTLDTEDDILDSVKKLKKDTKSIKRGHIIKTSKKIAYADKINYSEYSKLEREKTLTKEQKLSKERYEYSDKFSDDLLDNPDSYLLISGDIFTKIYSRLRLEYILRNLEIAKKLDLISINTKKSLPDQILPALSDCAIAYQFLGIFDLIDQDQEYSANSELIRQVITRWCLCENDVKTSTGIHLPSDYVNNPIRAIGRLLKKVGYKFELTYKCNSDRRYRIVRVFSQKLAIDDFNPVTGATAGCFHSRV
jgi:hypothetical protein